MENSSASLRPNESRANKTIALIWLILVLEIISMISGGMQINLLQTVADGGTITEEAATLNDTREQVIGIVYLLAFAASAFLFLQWFRRAYFNLHLLTTNLSFTEGWAAGAWFVPIISLYRPIQIMKELYVQTILLLEQKGHSLREAYNPSVINLWWALWVISGIVGQFVFRFSTRAETVDELITMTQAGLVSNILGIPLALVTINIIKKYSEIESLLPGVDWKEESTSSIEKKL